MKKLLLTLILALVCSISYAQHLNFCGVPIDGTITEFTNKLKTKGFSVDPASKTQPTGIRLFDGKYEGDRVKLGVYYEPRTKTVMAVIMMIPMPSWSDAVEKAGGFLYDLINEYGTDQMTQEEDGYSTMYIFETELGSIMAGYSEDDIFGPVAVKGFKDRINTERFE